MSADAAPGDLVEVRTERGRPLGLAFFSSTSQITLRMLGEGARDERTLFSERLKAAIAYRDALAPDGTAYRLVSAEADGLPALIVDRYAEYLVVQTLCQAVDRRLDLITELLADVLNPKGILARNDAKIWFAMADVGEPKFVTCATVPLFGPLLWNGALKATC